MGHLPLEAVTYRHLAQNRRTWAVTGQAREPSQGKLRTWDWTVPWKWQLPQLISAPRNSQLTQFWTPGNSEKQLVAQTQVKGLPPWGDISQSPGPHLQLKKYIYRKRVGPCCPPALSPPRGLSPHCSCAVCGFDRVSALRSRYAAGPGTGTACGESCGNMCWSLQCP